MYRKEDNSDKNKNEFDLGEVIENEGVDFGENKVNEDISKEKGEKTLFAALYG